MNIHKNTPDKKTKGYRKIYSVPLPKNTKKCKGCPYPGVGFICWSNDGSCMKTAVEKVSSRTRR